MKSMYAHDCIGHIELDIMLLGLKLDFLDSKVQADNDDNVLLKKTT